MNAQQQQEMLERNKSFLKMTVTRFMARCSQKNRNGIVSREDLMQEVTLCFLNEAEKYGEAIARTHGRTLLHAMYTAVMGAYPLSVPKRTASFKQIKSKGIWFDRWEDMAERIRVEDTSRKAIDRISIQERLEGLSEDDRQIIHWRLEGLTQREIGKRIGLSDKQMCERMKRIRREIMANQ